MLAAITSASSVADVAPDRVEIQALERVRSAVTGQAEPRDSSEREDVARGCRSGSLAHLWGNEPLCATDVGAVTHDTGRPQVEQKRPTIRREHDVSSRDVAVAATAAWRAATAWQIGVRIVTTSPGRSCPRVCTMDLSGAR
jgi:hypothetical protein